MSLEIGKYESSDFFFKFVLAVLTSLLLYTNFGDSLYSSTENTTKVVAVSREGKKWHFDNVESSDP